MIFLDSALDKVYKKAFPVRHDGNPALRYPSPTSYGLKESSFSFMSGKNRLVGYRYSNGNKPKAVLLFFHGATAGHRAYTTEIVSLCEQDYLVYAYDYTGCMMSEGKDCNGMAQPLLDQKAFFEFLENDGLAKGLDWYAIGHSWGGFCALACLQEQYNVKKVVCLAGFNSVADMSSHNYKKHRERIKKVIQGYLKRKYGPIGNLDGLELMKKTDREVLCVAGEYDDVVDYNHFYKRYEAEASSNPHIHFLSVKNRGHQCYWTADAQTYYLDLALKHHLRELDADPNLAVDYKRLLSEDKKVMQTIFDFLDS